MIQQCTDTSRRDVLFVIIAYSLYLPVSRRHCHTYLAKHAHTGKEKEREGVPESGQVLLDRKE